MGTNRRTTKQRDIILRIVRDSHSHPTADDVYSQAKAAMPALSLGTVYRNLRLLADEGTIKEVHFEGSANRFDGMTNTHEHFICNSCGKIADIEPTLGNVTTSQLHGQMVGSLVQSYSLNYYGLCSDCRESAK